MNVMVVGERRPAVEEALGGQGFDLVEPPGDELGVPGDEVAEIAAGLRAFETALGGGGVERLLLAGSSNLALAALLVATKMQIPVAAVDGDGGGPAEGGSSWVNGRVIESLADLTLADDRAAIAAWLRQSG